MFFEITFDQAEIWTATYQVQVLAVNDLGHVLQELCFSSHYAPGKYLNKD